MNGWWAGFFVIVLATLRGVVGPVSPNPKPGPNEPDPKPPTEPLPDPLPPEQSTPAPTPDPEPIPDPPDAPVTPPIPDDGGNYPKGYRVPWVRQQMFLTRVGLPFDDEGGPLTNRSVAQCQTASAWFELVGDGVPGPKTAKDWDVWEVAGFRVGRTFNLMEFSCNCIHHDAPGKPKGTRYPDCEIVWIARKTVVQTQRTRDNPFRGPVTPNSAYRCPSHNAYDGGVVHSQHLGTRNSPALAVDFPRVYAFAQFRPLGWRMLGIYGGRVGHADMRPGPINRTYKGAG